jgi:hypothetical protein
MPAVMSERTAQIVQVGLWVAVGVASIIFLAVVVVPSWSIAPAAPPPVSAPAATWVTPPPGMTRPVLSTYPHAGPDQPPYVDPRQLNADPLKFTGTAVSEVLYVTAVTNQSSSTYIVGPALVKGRPDIIEPLVVELFPGSDAILHGNCYQLSGAVDGTAQVTNNTTGQNQITAYVWAYAATQTYYVSGSCTTSAILAAAPTLVPAARTATAFAVSPSGSHVLPAPAPAH